MKKMSLLFIVLIFASMFASIAFVPVSAADDCDWDEKTCEVLEGADFGGRTMVVGVWGGTIEALYREHIIPEIEKHNGKVELLLGGTGDRVAKIYAERENPSMDIAYVNMFESAKGIKDGVFEVPSAEAVPAYADLYPVAAQDAYGMSFAALGIAYKPDLFDGEPEWEDLWNPELKGKIAVANFPGSDGEGFLTIAGYLAGGSDETPDLAFPKMAELKPIPLVYTSLDELFMMMEKGDVAAGPVFDAYTWTYIDEGYDIAFAYPTDPGPTMTMDTLAIVNDCPNRDMALAWAQMSLSPKVQKAFAEQIFFGPTNSTVELDGDVAEKVIYGEERANSLIRMTTYMTDHRAELVERWNREVLGE